MNLKTKLSALRKCERTMGWYEGKYNLDYNAFKEDDSPIVAKHERLADKLEKSILRHKYATETNLASMTEHLAEYAHQAWAGWMNYLFSFCEDFEGNKIIPKAKVDRWTRQVNTPYFNLPEEEKHSDRYEAKRILEIVGVKEND